MRHIFDKSVLFLISINRQFYFIAAIIWLIITTILSLLSASTVSKLSLSDFVGMDKLGHLVFYATLTFLWYMALNHKKYKNNTILIASIAFGGLMEFCQTTFTDGRVFEWNDMLANILGSVLGQFVFFRYFINLKND
jgi:VanZ family protein